MNSVNVMGRLVKNPEMKTFINDMGEEFKVITYRLAVNRGYKDKNGEQVVDFLWIKALNSKADFAKKYFKKGKRVAVTGRSQVDVIDNDNGTRTYFNYIYVEMQYFADGNNQPTAEQEIEADENEFNEVRDGEYTAF